ncbi:MAG: hypothetical protein IIV45_04405, partial [Lachnospiraceae bacterium]|nr:hypothetical protein [Lachnospiraceae bacterium]
MILLASELAILLLKNMLLLSMTLAKKNAIKSSGTFICVNAIAVQKSLFREALCLTKLLRLADAAGSVLILKRKQNI